MVARTTGIRRGKRTAVAVAAAALLTSGCGVGLGDLPLPAPGMGAGGYTLKAVFDNALNLPSHAKVKLGGADVGQLESMVARNYKAETTLRIMDGTRIPVGSIAELRSATPLGDVFVAIKQPTPADPNAPLLTDGDTITETAAAATVESVLASAALLVNGGTVRNFTNLVNGAGAATGDQGEALGDLISKSNLLLGKLNARSGEINAALTATARLADRLDEKNQALTEILEAAGPATDVLADNTAQLTDVIMTIGDTTRLLQKFPSIAGTDETGRSIIKDANTVAAAWNDVSLDPDTSLYALNRLMPPLVKSTPGSSISVRVSIDRLVIGSMPDAGFKGDLALHGPKRYDWAKLVGSIKYALWRLQERVVGKGPDTSMGQQPWAPVGAPIPPSPLEQDAPQGPPPGPPDPEG